MKLDVSSCDPALLSISMAMRMRMAVQCNFGINWQSQRRQSSFRRIRFLVIVACAKRLPKSALAYISEHCGTRRARLEINDTKQHFCILMISCRCTVDCKILFKPNKPADEWLSSHYEVYSLGQLGNKLSLAAYFCIFLLQRVHTVQRLTRYCTIHVHDQ